MVNFKYISECDKCPPRFPSASSVPIQHDIFTCQTNETLIIMSTSDLLLVSMLLFSLSAAVPTNGTHLGNNTANDLGQESQGQIDHTFKAMIKEIGTFAVPIIIILLSIAGIYHVIKQIRKSSKLSFSDPIQTRRRQTQIQGAVPESIEMGAARPVSQQHEISSAPSNAVVTPSRLSQAPTLVTSTADSQGDAATQSPPPDYTSTPASPTDIVRASPAVPIPAESSSTATINEAGTQPYGVSRQYQHGSSQPATLEPLPPAYTSSRVSYASKRTTWVYRSSTDRMRPISLMPN